MIVMTRMERMIFYDERHSDLNGNDDSLRSHSPLLGAIMIMMPMRIVVVMPEENGNAVKNDVGGFFKSEPLIFYSRNWWTDTHAHASFQSSGRLRAKIPACMGH